MAIQIFFLLFVHQQVNNLIVLYLYNIYEHNCTADILIEVMLYDLHVGIVDPNSPPMSESTYSNYSDGGGLYNGHQNSSPVCIKSEGQGKIHINVWYIYKCTPIIFS